MPTTFLTATWKYLAMLNYEIDPAALTGLVPAGTELDGWGGKTYVSMVGFLFLGTRVRGIPIPFHRNFEEVNLRFYVRAKGENGWARGVVFVKEIVPLPAVALTARWVYGENYVALPMRHRIEHTGGSLHVCYEWRFRGDWNWIEAVAQGEPETAQPGSLEEFISEHYWGYNQPAAGRTSAYRVEHPRWKVWRAESCRLECDAEALYGSRFVECLAGPPASAFLADGSEVAVLEGIEDPKGFKNP